MKKKFLFIVRRAPHSGIRAREHLDMMLAAAAFEQAVSVLFLDDGAWQLVAGQQPESAGLEPLAPVLEALPFYDVDAIWVEAESLQERGLSPERLVLPARLLERARAAAFIAGHEVLVAG